MDIRRILKYAPARLIGREAELEQLDAAWNQAVTAATPRPRVYTLVALGGEGKTSLVAKWAVRLSDNNWPGCAAAFAWSFYSQGAKDQSAASGELFLREALRFFGDPEMADSAQGAHEKGQRLALLVGAGRNLLILDGLEPLQFPPTSPTPGLLKDQGVAALLQGLSGQNAGLCVVTTRYVIYDLQAYQSNGAPQIDLPSLSVEAGAKLLRERGVTGSAADFAELVEEVKGHALTLTLLGAYLKDAHGGDIRKRDLIRLIDADAEEQGGHAFRVMDAYARWLEGDGEKGQRALAVLRLMGLFDRPADAGCLGALLQPPAINGLTEALVDLDESQRNLALSRLEAAHLVTVNRDAGALLSLDAHPLLRDYFAARLQRDQPDAWRAAHRRLFDHLCASTKEGAQPSLDDLQPLYQAVAHGCLAGMQQQVCTQVYYGRILRGGEAYSIKKLGAVASDLGAVGCFFDHPWWRVSPVLAENAQAWLLNEAAFRLRALGRLVEALEPMRAGLEMLVKREDWGNAAQNASNLSQLEATLGALNEAGRDAELAVNYADRSGDEIQRMLSRATHGDALHQAGARDGAAAGFAEAEAMQAEHQPGYPLLYSLRGFQYCDLLLAPAERAAWRAFLAPQPVPPMQKGEESADPLTACRAVSQRAEKMFEWRVPGDSLLSIALDHLTLGRAALYAALLGATPPGADCRAALDEAVTGLRRAGQSDYLPRGLLTRAWLRACASRHVGAESAQSDLDAAWEIAARGSMPLFLADIHLHRARLFGARDDYPWDSPAADLNAARSLIEKHGYGRRREELEDAESWWAAHRRR